MDTFRILMVLPSVFTRGWDPRDPILTQKSTPGGGGPKTHFLGFRGTPPTPPAGGGGGGGGARGTHPPPPRGRPPPPPPGGGGNPGQKGPPPGVPQIYA